MHIVHLQNIEKNGRIVTDNGGKEIFFLCLLHFNDTCKVNQQFTGGERKMIKLNSLNIVSYYAGVIRYFGTGWERWQHEV